MIEENPACPSTTMTDAEMQQVPILGILPQRPPFIMIGQLRHYDPSVTITRFTVEAGNVFCQEGTFVASGLVENIAQTCAARIGFINKYILHKDVNIGYIGAIRNLAFECLPLVGQTIETRIEVLSQEFGITLAHAEIRRVEDDALVANGEMKIALSEKTV